MLSTIMRVAPLPFNAPRLAHTSSGTMITRSLSTSISVHQAKPVAATGTPAYLPGYPSSRFLTDIEQCWVDPAKRTISLGGTIPTFRLTDITGQLLPNVSEQSLEVCFFPFPPPASARTCDSAY